MEVRRRRAEVARGAIHVRRELGCWAAIDRMSSAQQPPKKKRRSLWGDASPTAAADASSTSTAAGRSSSLSLSLSLS
eukprot:COSAG02_NODE_11440_length_1723_cov_1.512315_3_plen_76_part_01